MLFDYHSHTTRCGHAEGTMEEYIERAQALGMAEFGFSEHSPWMVQDPGQWNCLKEDEVELYVADVRRLQKKHNNSNFTLKLGLEADFVPSRLPRARAFFEQHPWDYVIGSVHHLGFWCLPKTSESAQYALHSAGDVCEFYYHFTGEMIDARFCDIIAHIDLPKKHGMKIPGGTLRWVAPLIPRIKAAGMSVEINTGGLDGKSGEPFPSWDAIAALAEAKVPLLVNSDSHKPSQVGRHFRPVLEKLTEIGVEELVSFAQRKPALHSVADALGALR